MTKLQTATDITILEVDFNVPQNLKDKVAQKISNAIKDLNTII